MSLFDIEFTKNNGEKTTLKEWSGKVLYIVNVASRCGYTPQYTELEALYKKYDGKVVVLAFPSNDYREQEGGTDQEILEFCSTKYNVTFPIMKKAPVSGENKQPLFAELIKLQPNTVNRSEIVTKLKGYNIETFPEDSGEVSWNFEKFVVSPDGKTVQRFASTMKPDDEQIISVVDSFLQ